MAVVGRNAAGSSVEQLAATLATTITSADVGKVAYFNGAEFGLLVSVDATTLTNSLVGVISAITVDGDGLGAQAQGFVTIRGTIQKAGALSGQVYFVGVGADLVLAPPVDSFAIRVGFSRQNNFLYVDLDPNTIQIAVLSQRLTELETLVEEIADEVLAAPVYDFASGDDWGVNPEGTNTDFGLDDNWTEGTVGYNSDFGADDNWAELTII